MTNGEKYKTAKERRKAFMEYIVKGDSISAICEFAWLDLEAKPEEKPMPCPFCGEDTFAYPYNSAGRKAMYKVCCKNCSYNAKAYYNKDEAIAAHNRVCKAVAAYKEREMKREKKNEALRDACGTCSAKKALEGETRV